MIRLLKERVRGYMHSLCFVMNRQILVGCVMFCVSRINLQPSSTSTDRTSPREQFSGIKLNFDLDLRVEFGDLCQCTVPMPDGSMAARTQGMIALLPTGNSTGSVKMLVIATGKIATRDQFTVVPMSVEVCTMLTASALKDGLTCRGEEPLAGTSADEDTDSPEPEPEPPSITQRAEMMPIDGRPDVVIPGAEPAALDLGVESGVAPSEYLQLPEEYEVSLRRSTRSTAGQPPDRLGAAESLLLAAKAEGDRMEIHRQMARRAHWHDSPFALAMSLRAALHERGEEARPSDHGRAPTDGGQAGVELCGRE
jgi:hypothetical protein